MEFYTVKQMSMRHPAFSEPSLRALIFNAEKDGLAPAIVRVKRKVLIHELMFLRWIRDNRCLVREEENKNKENPNLISDQSSPKKSEKLENRSKKTKNVKKSSDDDQQDLF